MSALFLRLIKPIITIASVRTAAVKILSFIPKRKITNYFTIMPFSCKIEGVNVKGWVIDYDRRTNSTNG